MAWTTPRDWTADELVTATIMNTHIRDNQIALKSPPSDYYNMNEGSDLSGLNSATFADIDATNWALSLTTAGGDIMVWAHMTLVAAVSTTVYFDIDIDGSRIGGDDGFFRAPVLNSTSFVSFFRLIPGIAAGAHTIKLQYKTGGTLTLYRGAGTGSFDVHPQFGAREIS